MKMRVVLQFPAFYYKVATFIQNSFVVFFKYIFFLKDRIHENIFFLVKQPENY